MKVEELGLNPAFTVGGKATPWYDQPWAPFATAMVRKTDAAGNGWLSPLIHLGHPGLYTIVMQADSVRSWPMYVPVLSKLSSMEISTQPSMQDASMTTLGLVVGESLTGGGGWHWPVGQELAVPMKVTLKDASGNALELYQPMVVPVHPNTGAPLDHLVSLDLPTIGLAQTDRGIGSTGFKRGTPADSSGVSLFPLKLIDGVHGTCFVLKAWFKAFSPADVAILVGEGVSLNADGTTSFDDTEVAATSTVRFCVKNEVAVAVASQRWQSAWAPTQQAYASLYPWCHTRTPINLEAGRPFIGFHAVRWSWPLSCCRKCLGTSLSLVRSCGSSVSACFRPTAVWSTVASP